MYMKTIKDIVEELRYQIISERIRTMEVFMLFDQACGEFTRILLSENHAMFERQIRTDFESIKKACETNLHHPLKVLVDYPNQFDWYHIGTIDMKTATFSPCEIKQIVLNYGQI